MEMIDVPAIRGGTRAGPLNRALPRAAQEIATDPLRAAARDGCR
ncbi:MAG: hypothetical protein M0026_16540 [Nocardiopsaceae bacterium]|nr:hypothetical protein [Nocardiopsaceae bacterium]